MTLQLKLREIVGVSDTALVALSLNCPLILEIDVHGCPLVTSVALHQVFRTSMHLRELNLASCSLVTESAFPSAFVSYDETTQPLVPEDERAQLVLADGFTTLPVPIPLDQPPRLRTFDHLRFLDLTSLTNLTDNAVAGIVRYMPRIRNLVLAKCENLTDNAVDSICSLGKHLHFLHMGHLER